MTRKLFLEKEMKSLDKKSQEIGEKRYEYSKELDKILAVELAESIFETSWDAGINRAGDGFYLSSPELGYDDVTDAIEFDHASVNLDFMFDRDLSVFFNDGDWSIEGDSDAIMDFATKYHLEINTSRISNKISGIEDTLESLKNLIKIFNK